MFAPELRIRTGLDTGWIRLRFSGNLRSGIEASSRIVGSESGFSRGSDPDQNFSERSDPDLILRNVQSGSGVLSIVHGCVLGVYHCPSHFLTQYNLHIFYF